MTDAPALERMRIDYASRPLDVDDLAPTWYEQLTAWLEQAREAGLTEPNAMVLATSDPDGLPSSRTVLCKGLDAGGIVFYTNYTSAKSHDLNRTRVASVTFPWYDLQRQVQLSGRVERCSEAQSDAYWALRPRGSQLGAWASAQSTIVAGRTVLDQALAGVTRRFEGVEEIPRPPHWGGWRIVPWQVEFWQGRADRMHDRLRFEVGRDDSWSVRRLAP
ncbi:Pyridoxamine 5'-phosphate oxidase [Pseudonocardia sp. Ae406_Ps2]|uniref:pyridoxamine 5'-phosphate oxidase n=1 Tax=unclassified Pseudonocardia TaxID=2619320 RepID=UPI0002E8E4D6|nr:MULTISPECIES: pyridoxamine 5'-phosphate oxidase [unclassified Pseudonocardia]KAA1028752.1 pyridoxamine 5'-phosphate oxidase [Pseudonocardia sp. EV170527-09]OLL99096.1 Pyridoxamine 5'-phosphate oxidase [Pseudonocardia sp. Ae331_Ps2]OLM03164.1 Pyridoxamine 5'-phosphate oxidase [Pseudonocardia sp. Ae406_Ps2]OLM24720.1 Pyridoxamine 5'-phosphate oxidase [Pseudonocardia sp. Ae706_Ps2]OLM29344.1 Pyridoxamine 5'-phosphate oxidase [Pseudonocardia sp. Ae717_Ps2]